MKAHLPYARIVLVAGLLSAPGVRAAQHRPSTAAELMEVFSACKDGDEVILADGTFAGNFRVTKRIRITGMGGVLDGGEQGTVLTLDAPEIVLEEVHVRTSGTNLSGPDSGIYLTPKASGSRISSSLIENCAFGIWVHECRSVTIGENRIMGIKTGHTSNRGNGIQLFDSPSGSSLDILHLAPSPWATDVAGLQPAEHIGETSGSLGFSQG